MELKIKSNKTLLLHAVAKKADGTSTDMSTISFKVEKGTAQLSDGPSGKYKIVSIADPNPSIIRVDANVELDPKAPQKILTSRLLLNIATPAPTPGAPIAKPKTAKEEEEDKAKEEAKAKADVKGLVSLVLTAEEM